MYSFLGRLAPLCRRCRSTDRRFITRRRPFSTATLIFAGWSARIPACCVSGNASALVLPSVKHSLLQTLSSNRIRHRCVLLFFHSLHINVVIECSFETIFEFVSSLSLPAHMLSVTRRAPLAKSESTYLPAGKTFQVLILALGRWYYATNSRNNTLRFIHVSSVRVSN
jgi:hypothetical protein